MNIDLQDFQQLIDTEEDGKEQTEKYIDYKMVTFSLAGKDYGIDIMKVKEISKAAKFTFVPNALPFVRGVYNLRGDIISIIDLRVMFNLPAPKNPNGLENMIILRLDERIIGIIVDSIDKVVGIASSSIQPPHPLFGDINIRFINGITENEGRLYIILDAESIFSKETEEKQTEADRETAGASYQSLSQRSEGSPAAAVEAEAAPAAEADMDLEFITESLKALAGFYVTEINADWVRKRFSSWQEERKAQGKEVQLKNSEDADQFLQGFPSINSGQLWNEGLMKSLEELLPDTESGQVSVWNAGCQSGYESYSVAVALRERYPSKRIKIWAHDKDLISISTAPNLNFQKNNIPAHFDAYMGESGNGYQFAKEIKDLILFEYHDILNSNQFPHVDLVVCRDLLSYLPLNEQLKFISEIEDRIKKGGLLVLGNNEDINGAEWEQVSQGELSVFRKL